MMAPVNLAKLEEAKRTGQRQIGAFYKRIVPPRMVATYQASEPSG